VCHELEFIYTRDQAHSLEMAIEAQFPTLDS